jgi:phenylacetate-CoA ligase
MDLSSKIKLTSRVKNFISYRRLLLPMTEIHEQDIINHLKDIKKYRVNFIRSFPGPLTEVASYILSHSGNEFALQGVVTTGEILHDHQRKVIEKAFQCPVFDSYRTREVGPIAQECEHHRGLHINAEGVMVEIESIPDSGTENQNEGKILVTDLHNYAMPFIRYEIGDRGTLAKNVCGCGRGLPLLEKVGGRVMDVLYTTRGRRIASISVIPLLVANLGLTNQLQFVQQTLKKMVIRMSEPRPEVTILDKQQQIARKIFGEELEITYEFVPHIPLLASGKYRMTICEIPADQQVTLGN